MHNLAHQSTTTLGNAVFAVGLVVAAASAGFGASLVGESMRDE